MSINVDECVKEQVKRAIPLKAAIDICITAKILIILDGIESCIFAALVFPQTPSIILDGIES